MISSLSGICHPFGKGVFIISTQPTLLSESSPLSGTLKTEIYNCLPFSSPIHIPFGFSPGFNSLYRQGLSFESRTLVSGGVNYPQTKDLWALDVEKSSCIGHDNISHLSWVFTYPHVAMLRAALTSASATLPQCAQRKCLPCLMPM